MSVAVGEFELPAFDYLEASLKGERFHAATRELRETGRPRRSAATSCTSTGPTIAGCAGSSTMTVAEERPQIERAVTEFYDYTRELVERRRTEPGDDLVSSLIDRSRPTRARRRKRSTRSSATSRSRRSPPGSPWRT
ncbi:MAG TPA: hypothetical protein VFG79_21740 [Solirubrobacter sp.]|nr:hypothetical protein [Solirubrobacter sp.]